METVADVICAWETIEEFAADAGVKPNLAAVWKHRDSIPSSYWTRIVAAATRRQIQGISLEMLARIAAKRMSGAGDAA